MIDETNDPESIDPTDRPTVGPDDLFNDLSPGQVKRVRHRRLEGSQPDA